MTESADELHPFGAGSHAPLADEREMPECYPIKGNADSMLYHRPDSRNYGATIAEVWFVSPSAAEAAGFTLSSTHPKDSSSADFEPGAEGHPCTAEQVRSTVYGGNETHPYGAGSHAPLADEREMPECYPIKGNADSMLYHRPDSRNYGATIAEVWFVSPSAAEAAGFTLSSTHPKDSSSADFEPGTDGHPCTAEQVAGLSFAGTGDGAAAGVAAAAAGAAGVLGIAGGLGGDGDAGDGDAGDGAGGAGGDVRATLDASAPDADVRATIDQGAGAAADAAGGAADSVADSARETVRMPAAGAAAAVAGAGAAAGLASDDADADAGDAGEGDAGAGSGSGDASGSAGGSGDGGGSSAGGGSGDGSDDGSGGGSAWDGMSDDERHPFGPGSHVPDPDDVHRMPPCHPIKGNADSMKYHRPDSHSYAVTTAEVWFVSPSVAEAAGFALAGAHPKGSSSADFEPGADGHPCSAADVEGLGLGGLLLGAGAGAGAVAGLAALGGDGDGGGSGDVDAGDAAADLDATTEMAAAATSDVDATTEMPAAAASAAAAGAAAEGAAGAETDSGAATDAAAAWDGMSEGDLHPFGPGSHAPNPVDVHLMPACHPIKGNADSMKYHRPDSQGYEPTKAEVWFVSPSVAEAAGFALAGSHPEGSSSADFEPGASGHPCSAADVEGMGLGGLLLGGAALAGAGALAGSLLGGDGDADIDTTMGGDVDETDLTVASLDEIGVDEADLTVASLDGDVDEADLTVASLDGDVDEADLTVASIDGDITDADLTDADGDITVDDDDDGKGGLGLAAAAAAGAAALGGAALLGGDDDTDLDADLGDADVDLTVAGTDFEDLDADLSDTDVDLPDPDLTVAGAGLAGASLDGDDTDADLTVSSTDDDDGGLGLGAAAAGAAAVGGAAAAGIAGRRGGAKAGAAGDTAAASGSGGGRGRGPDDDDDDGGFGWGWLKWLLPLLLLLLLLGLLLAFCGGDEDDTTPVAAVPTATAVPPTATAVPEPTATPEPEPTATPEPEPTATPEPEPTATPEPEPTATPEPTPEPPSCASLGAVLEDNGFTTLLAAVGVAGAGDALSNSGPLTVFAPTDEAFAAVPEAITAALLADTDLLTQVLQYHAVEGAVFSTDLAPGAVPTFNGSALAIRTDLDGPRVNASGVTVADLEADACVVHGVDGVLVPPALLSTLGVASLNDAVAGGPITFVDGTADFTDADSNTLAAICALVSGESDLDGLPAVQWQRSGDAAIDEARAAAIADALAGCGADGLAVDALAPKPAFTG